MIKYVVERDPNFDLRMFRFDAASIRLFAERTGAGTPTIRPGLRRSSRRARSCAVSRLQRPGAGAAEDHQILRGSGRGAWRV